MVFETGAYRGHEQVTYVSDETTGLQAIIAVHDTTLGPALGGARMREYASSEAALTDVLRLSHAMTYKAATADLPLGGGKAVILGAPESKDEAMMRAYGQAIADLGGKYITSVDMNTSVADMDIIAGETPHVAGTSAGLGDPSPITAYGVVRALEACAEFAYGGDSLADIHVAIQGLGKVGGRVAQTLAERGTTLTVADPDETTVSEFVETYGADAVSPESIYDVSCDILSPCAVGGVINDETIKRLDCDIVAGGANNILADETKHAQALHDRGVLYAPDYVINAGGLITVAKEPLGGTREEAFEETAQIYERLLEMFEQSASEDITVLEAAQRYAEQRLAAESRQPAPVG